MSSHPFRAGAAALATLAISACGRADARSPDGRGPGERSLVVETLARLDDRGQGLLARPERMSVDPAGRFVITDISDKNLKLYDAHGARVLTVGRAGHGPGEFSGLIAGQAFRDSLIGYDIDGARVSVFTPDGRYTRSYTVGARGLGIPFYVRAVDDSLLLLISSPVGHHHDDLVRLARGDGSPIRSFFNQRRYFDDQRDLIQRTGVLADAAGGVVFTTLVGGDSVWAFDYAGRRLGSAPVDPVQPLVTVRTLLARNGGKLRRGDGHSVVDGARNVIGLVALDSATVALQVAAYDAVRGTDPVEGGTMIVASLGPNGALRTIARQEVAGALLGRDRQGNALLLRYAGGDEDHYEVARMRLSPLRTAGRAP
jgi:hypothetical protein